MNTCIDALDIDNYISHEDANCGFYRFLKPVQLCDSIMHSFPFSNPVISVIAAREVKI